MSHFNDLIYNALKGILDGSIGGTPGSYTDTFGSLAVSSPDTRLDVEFLYDKQPDYFDETTTNGVVTFNANRRDLELGLFAAADGDNATMLSHPNVYTPGNAQEVKLTGVFDAASLGGGTMECFLRSSVTGTPVDIAVTPQSSWENLTSGVDWATSHIMGIEFQSLKVGSIDFFVFPNGVKTRVCRINNDNTRLTGYWQTPNLPCGWRLYCTATETIAEMLYGDENNGVGFRYRVPSNSAAKMRAICCTVKSRGGGALRDLPGVPRAIDMGVTPKTVSTTLIPLISIRSKATFGGVPNNILTIPENFALQASDAIKFEIIQGGTLTGPSWVDVDTTGSCMEYDVTATAISGGQKIYSEYLPANSSGPSATRTTSVGEGVLGKTVLWNRRSSQSNVLTIAAIRTSGSDSTTTFAAMDWEELR